MKRFNNVLITGGDGFVALHNADYLLSNNLADRVILLDNQSRTHGRNSASLVEKFGDRVSPVIRDVRDFMDILPYFKGVDLVYHMAAQVTMTRSLEDPLEDFYINSVGSMNVLEAVHRMCPDSPVIYCSTNKVYGDIIQISRRSNKPYYRKFNPDKDFVVSNGRHVYAKQSLMGITEEGFHVGPEAANCPYGSSKMAGELSMKNYFDSYGIKSVRARMSCIYGTHQYGCEDQGWLSWFTIRTLLDKPITIYGDGLQVRDVLYGSDHARAFYEMAITPSCYGEAFNLGGGPDCTLSLHELLQLIEEFSGKRSELKYAPWRHGDQKVYISDVSKLSKATNWRPDVSVRDGVKSLVDWTSDNLDKIKEVAPQVTQ